jgi:hypothetical protein
MKEDESVEQMTQTDCVDLPGPDLVTLSLACVPALNVLEDMKRWNAEYTNLIVCDPSTCGAARSLATRWGFADRTRAVALLAWRPAKLGLWILAMNVLGTTPAVEGAAELQATLRSAICRVNTTHR